MAAEVGITETSLRPRARECIVRSRKDDEQPLLHLRSRSCASSARAACAPATKSQGTFALTIQGRGFDSKVAASQNEPFLDSECVSCGACVEACPTAALTEKSVIGWAAPSAPSRRPAPTAASAARFKAEVNGEGADVEVVRMVPNRDGHANHGHACVKGRFAFGYATHRDRVTKPMIRKSITRCRGAKSPGTRRSTTPRASSGASRRSTAGTRSAASPPRAARTRRRSWCRSSCARRSATTTSTPARASAIRRPATA